MRKNPESPDPAKSTKYESMNMMERKIVDIMQEDQLWELDP